MVDSDNSLFVATCQQNGPLDHTEIASAEAALAWGRERAERIVIRLGHTEDTYFTAGDKQKASFTRWPPAAPPVAGWWSPGAAGQGEPASGEWSVQFRLRLQGDRELGEAPARAFTVRIADDAAVHGITETETPAPGSIRVTAVVLAGTRVDAEVSSDVILNEASTAAGRQIPDWSTIAWWSGFSVEGPAS
jgi:hypothetical protein